MEFYAFTISVDTKHLVGNLKGYRNLEQYHSIICHKLNWKIVISTLKKHGK